MIVIAQTSAPPACAVPNSPPHATSVARPVGAERYIAANHRSGTVDIKVFLGTDGTVTRAIVFHSSGDLFLDSATYDAAISTVYAPEIRNCHTLAGAYIYRTKYSAQAAAPQPPAPSPAPSSAAPATR